MLPQLALPQIEALQLLVESKKYSRCAPYFSTVRNDGYAALTSSKYITVTCSSSPKVK